jgi:hypothetical protein
MKASVKTTDGNLVHLDVARNAEASELFQMISKQTGFSMSDFKRINQRKWPISPLPSLTDQAVLERSALEMCSHSQVINKEQSRPNRKGNTRKYQIKKRSYEKQQLLHILNKKQSCFRTRQWIPGGESANIIDHECSMLSDPTQSHSHDCGVLGKRHYVDLPTTSESLKRPSEFTVFVKTPSCDVLQIKLEDDSSGFELYSQVEHLSGISVTDFKLLNQGKWPISLSTPLVEQAVRKGSTLDLFIGLKAGGDNEVKQTSAPDHEKLSKFQEIMIRDTTKGPLSDPFLTVEKRKLNSTILNQCLERAKSEKSGLTRHLSTFMIDLLKRRCRLDALTSYNELEGASDGRTTLESIAESFPDVFDYCEFKHKELLISLFEIFPKKSWSRLMALAAQVGCSCPFLYPVINSQRKCELKMIPHAFSDVLCLPESPLVLSCGVSNCTGKGKTDLLSLLFGFPAEGQEDALERHSRGPCHNLSIDLAFQGVINEDLDTFIVADVHGYSSESKEYKAALTALASGAELTLLHVTSADFSDDGTPGLEVQEVLQCCSSKMSSKTCSVIILWRDVSGSKNDRDKLKKVESNLTKLCGCTKDLDIHHFEIPDLKGLSKMRLGLLLSQLTSKVSEVISQRSANSPLRMMPTAKVLRTNCTNLLFHGTSPSISAATTSMESEWDGIGDEVHRLLHLAASQCQQKTLFDILFPSSTIDSSLAKLEERGDRIAKDRNLSKKAYSELDKLTTEVRNLKSSQKDCPISSLVEYFVCTAVRGKVEAVQDFDRQLNTWKEPKCRPYMERRSKLHRELEERLADLKKHGQDEKSDPTILQIKDEIQRNSEELDRYDISIDDVWSEVMSLSTPKEDKSTMTLLQKYCGIDPDTIQDAYRDCVLAGHPMQLLRGRPLYMAGDFLSSVLLSIQKQSERKLFVISVIGMQSSAKSTLLNYLFGCGFATRAGRCTKGLYASYMQTDDLDILVLDSEGLMSVEGDKSRDFDNEVTLMAMACSHIVIINQKGEIHRQLRDLLEVSLFCLKHLKESVLRLAPDILFVLRDQADLETKALEDQFRTMRDELTRQGGKLNVNVTEFIDLNTNAVFLFPSAFDTKDRNGKTVKKPSPLFSEKVFDLRKNLFDRHNSKFQASIQAFSTMQNWVSHAKGVWTSIRKYGGNLVYYQNMHEIEQRQAVSKIFNNIVKNEMEDETGYDAQFDKILQEYLTREQQDVTSRTARKYLEKSLSKKVYTVTAAVTEMLKEELKGQNYPVPLCTEFEEKLVRRVKEKSEAVLESWAYYEAKMKADEEPDKIEKTMKVKMDTLFQERNRNMPYHELDDTFESLWKENVGHVKKLLKERWLTDVRLEEHINFLFANQVTINQDQDVYTVLRTGVTGIPEKNELMLQFPMNIDRWDKYIRRTTWWITEKLSRKTIPEDTAKQMIIFEAFQRVASCFKSAEMVSLFKDEWNLDSLLMKRQISLTVTMIRNFDDWLSKAYEGRFKVEKTTFGNDVQDCLRRRIFDEYRIQRDEQLRAKFSELDGLKDKIKERIVLRLCGLEDDKNRAKQLVQNIVEGVGKKWFPMKEAVLLSKAKCELQQKMNNAEEAATEAFECSFKSRKWEAVKAYCDNAFEFLRSIYDERYDLLSKQYRDKEVNDVKSTLTSSFDDFDKQVEEWSQSANAETTTSSLISHCEQNGKEDNILLQYAGEAMKVTNPANFALAYKAARKENPSVSNLIGEVERKFTTQLQKVKKDIWDIAQGCSAVCPLCSAKCSRAYGHYPSEKHDCKIHLFPAFNGVAKFEDKTPVLTLCTSKRSVESKYIRKTDEDGKLRPLKDHYAKYYPGWVVPIEKPDFQHETDLRKAWINTKDYFLKKYGMTDGTPVEWQ